MQLFYGNPDMAIIILKTIVTVLVVLGLTWLNRYKPNLAGILLVLPWISLTVVLFSHIEQGNDFDVRSFVKGMYMGLPIFLGFYAPFLAVENFYLALTCGIIVSSCLTAAYRYFGLI